MNDFSSRPVKETERFLPAPLLRFLLDLEATRTTEDVWTLLVSLAQSLGLPVVDYVYASDYKNWEKTQFIRTTFDSKWFEYLKKFPHIRQTSHFRTHGCKHLTPILIGPAYAEEIGHMSEEKQRHMELSAAMGARAGIAIPLRSGEPGQAALIAFAGPQDKADFDALLTEHGWTLHAVALSAHARYTELFKTEFIERNELTTKQKELITLVGQGYLDKQIAHTLGISFSAVRQRLSSVQAKTGARNRAELAALAMRIGLVSDPMLRTHDEDLTIFLTTGDGKTGSEPRRNRATSHEV